MLILQRRPGEETKIGGNAAGPPTLFDKFGRPVEITVTVLGVKGNQVRIGFDVPKVVPVHREEIYERIRREQQGDAEFVR